jgi:perosamine synthetase
VRQPGLWARHQPPVHSPIPAGAVPAATAAAMGAGADPRPVLAGDLCREFSARAALLCGSGTQALELALVVARRRAGADTVALPAFSCYDVASAAVGAGARVLLYDLDPGTLGPDLDSLRRAVAGGARTVVVAPLYGVPVDWRGVEAVVAGAGVVVVEDAAQGSGARWEGRPLGTLGELSVLSFGRGKGWTGGGGGVLLVREERDLVAAQEGMTRSGEHGQPGVVQELGGLAAAVAQAAVARPALFALPSALPWLGLGETRYRPPRPIRSITRAAAALLLRSRNAARSEAEARRAHGAWYARRLDSSPGAGIPAVPRQGEPGYLRFPIRLAGGLDGFPDPGAARRLGIAPAYPTTLLALEPVRRAQVGSDPRCPGAEELARTLVTLPTHSLVTPTERSRVVDMITSPAARTPPLEVSR